MALFGFGKKKTKQKIQEIEKIIFKPLNRRAYPRYIIQNLECSIGEVVELSKNYIKIVAQEQLYEVEDVLPIKIENKPYEIKILHIDGAKIGCSITPFIDKEIIQKYMYRPIHIPLQPKSNILSSQEQEVCREFNNKRNRALINLMHEIDDPNAKISDFERNIEALPKLQEKLVQRANAIEVAGRGVVEDVGVAIGRLGFDEVKKIVYQYITYEAPFSHEEMKEFTDFDVYNILMGALFKKLAPLFNFHDLRNEGQSLMLASSLGANILSLHCKKLESYYKSPKELFDFEMRMYEYFQCTYDFLEINKIYFLKKLEVFTYLYDGFILANMMLHPYYEPRNLTIELSNRKMRFAYVAYLSILALRYIFSKEKESGYTFFHRMQRLGFTPSEAQEWLNNIIDDTNKKLLQIGMKKKLPFVTIPPTTQSAELLLGGGIYATYLLSRFAELADEASRIVIRYEDALYSHFVLERILNEINSPHFNESFCVVPCGRIEDEELPLAMFEGFDMLIFKDFHKLSQRLEKDFEKLWKDFEGKIICTYDSAAMLEYEREHLYGLIREQIVDFPSYAKSPNLEMKMLKVGCARINSFFQRERCQIEEFKEDNYIMESLYSKSFEKEG